MEAERPKSNFGSDRWLVRSLVWSVSLVAVFLLSLSLSRIGRGLCTGVSVRR